MPNTRTPTPSEVRRALSVLGRLGGSARSDKKTAACRANARKRWADYRARLEAEAPPGGEHDERGQ